MSVDTEKPTVQSNEIEPSHSNNSKSTTSTATTTTTSTTGSSRFLNSSDIPSSTTSTPRMTAVASPRELPPSRSQTPPPIPRSKSRPTAPESPRASYFRRIREQQERAVEKFFQTTIDAPCYALEEQLDYITRCQQPKAFWNMFHGSHSADDGTVDGVVHVGMYVLPQYCEYCGASNTRLCPSTCQRPKLFFRNKRPPFCNQLHQWDSQTEYAIPKSTSTEECDVEALLYVPNIIMDMAKHDDHHHHHHHHHHAAAAAAAAATAGTTTTNMTNKSRGPSPSNWVHGIFHGDAEVS